MGCLPLPPCSISRRKLDNVLYTTKMATHFCTWSQHALGHNCYVIILQVTNNQANSHNFKQSIKFTYSDFPCHFKVNSDKPALTFRRWKSKTGKRLTITANFQEWSLGTALSGKKIRPVGRIVKSYNNNNTFISPHNIQEIENFITAVQTMIGALAARNNLRVKNARQPVKRKDV